MRPILLLFICCTWLQAGEPIRVMPLGDSITQAARGHASYRYWLWKLLEKTDHPVDFVGSLRTNFKGEPKYTDFDRDHEGHWGWRVDQVLPELDAWLAAGKPDIVLVHLGTNDLREPIAQIKAELKQLIDKIRAYRADTTILLAQLIPVQRFAKIDAINEAIAELAEEEAPIVLVDQHTGYDGVGDNYDGVHPNEGGEQKMARRWFAALTPVLEKK